MTGYSIDTNIVINMSRDMPRDVWSGIWDAMEELVATGRANMTQEAFRELGGVDDGCTEWAKQLPGFVHDANDEEIAVAVEISQRLPTWVQDKKNAADPWVIAHAKIRGLTVVSEERPNGPGALEHNLKIPTVAAMYDVACINLVGLARAESWSFV